MWGGMKYTRSETGWRWISREMRKVVRRLWRTGKHAYVWMVVLSLLPFLFPVLVVLLCVGIMFIVPLCCGIGAYVLFSDGVLAWHINFRHTSSGKLSPSLPQDPNPSCESPELKFSEEKFVVHKGGSDEGRGQKAYEDERGTVINPKSLPDDVPPIAEKVFSYRAVADPDGRSERDIADKALSLADADECSYDSNEEIGEFSIPHAVYHGGKEQNKELLESKAVPDGLPRKAELWTSSASLDRAHLEEQSPVRSYEMASPSSKYLSPPYQRFRHFEIGGRGFPAKNRIFSASPTTDYPAGSDCMTPQSKGSDAHEYHDSAASVSSDESKDLYMGEFEELLHFWREKERSVSPSPTASRSGSPAVPAEVAAQLRKELNEMKLIIGKQFSPHSSIWQDVQVLSENVGMRLPYMGDVSDLTKARQGLELLKVVVGIR